jgi:Mor family transcriptional regulator
MSFVQYINAEVILPDNLVEEIQKYIQGGYLYIPCQPQVRKMYRGNNYIKNRNENIRNRHKNGDKIKDLAEEFYLSIDSIKKIVYKKKI